MSVLVDVNVMGHANPMKNLLLAALPASDLERLTPHLVSVGLEQGQVIYEPHGSLRHVYFPTTSVISLLYVTKEGAPTEIAIVGNEGVVGVALFMGGETTVDQAVVQSAGQAYRLDARVPKEEFRHGSSLQRLLLRYAQAVMTQISQTAVCNRQHSIEQQLCRWLLLTVDRLPSGPLSINEDMIANMLGASRVGLVDAILKLTHAGLVRYDHGVIEVLDKPGVEARACECYQVVRQEFNRLLPRSVQS